MKAMKKWLITALSFATALFAGLGFVFTGNTVSVEAAQYVAADYVPTKSDVLDYDTAVSEVDGGGVFMFANAGLNVPLDASYIKVETSFKLPSTESDGIDSWVTYSFTPTVAATSADVPSGTVVKENAAVKGYYFQISNVSKNSAPNCAEVGLYALKGDGTVSEPLISVFLNDSVDKRITLSLMKTADGLYTISFRNENDAALTFTKTEDAEKEKPDILSEVKVAMDETLFVSNGQTYLSTAIFEDENCTATDHADHRGVTLYSVRSYEISHPITMAGYDYVPSTSDVLNCYTGPSSVTGGGVVIGAHSGLSVPLDGAYISMDTTINLASGNWLTYSFTSAIINKTADSTIPNYGNSAANPKGIFFHVSYSASTYNPNGVGVDVVYNDGTGNTKVGQTIYVANILGVPINFALKANPDKTYDWAITKQETDGTVTVLASLENLALDADLFVNDDGQTYFSSALYSGNDTTRSLTITKIRTMDYGKPCTTNYTPVAADITDLYSTVSLHKGTLAFTGNSALKSPINGYNIAVTGEFDLKSAKAEADGGEGADGWATYSFSATAPVKDSQIPYYSGSEATGIYFQMKNVSNVSNGETTLNCAQVSLVQVNNGSRTDVKTAYVDGICNGKFTLSLRWMSENVYTISFANASGAVVATWANIALTEDLFVNEHGQTYFSSAIYVEDSNAAKTDRMVKLYSINEMPLCENSDVEVLLGGASYGYTVGATFEPSVKVLAGNKELIAGTDYTVKYLNNDAPGTATVTVDFIGAYYGVDSYETYFQINEPSPSDAMLAAIVEELQSSFTMDYGAAVKMSSPTGLRFGANVNITALNKLKEYVGADNVSVGTIILPFDSLDAGELPRADSEKTKLDIKNTNMSEAGKFYAAIWNISESNYTRQFAARSYVSYVSGEKTYYIYATMDDNVRSVNYVAQAALLDEKSASYKPIHLERLQDFASKGQAYYDDNSDIQYVTYMITNKSVKEIEAYIKRMKAIHGENDPTSGRMYAFGVPGPFPLSQSVEEMKEMVDACFTLAKTYNVPVFFQVDDMTNYINFGSWAENQFGNGAAVKFYEHPEMCEWVQFPTEGEEYGGQDKYGRLPRWYFNWGGEASTTACPNLASPEFRALLRSQLQEGFLKPLIENMEELRTANKGYLFAGCNVGWETQIPDYSSDSLLSSNLTTLEDWEKTEYGYAALHSLGYTAESLAAEASANGVSVDEQRKTILYGVIQDFIEFVCKLVYDAGVPRNLIYTHTIANGSVNGQYDTMMPPLWVAINDYSTPGYTMANGNWNQATLEKVLEENGASTYIIAEGYKDGYNTEDAAKAYFEEQFGGNCRNITVFGYDEEDTADTSADYFEQAVNQWIAKEILPE